MFTMNKILNTYRKKTEQDPIEESALTTENITKPERESWESYFINIASLVATRSTCIRRQVGCVLVKDNRIIATGYNGVPSGLSHCTKETCLRNIHQIPSGTRHELCRGLHAEMNVIIQAAKFGISVEGSVLYITNYPCSICTKIILNSGIKKIYYREGYPDELAKELINEGDIPCIQI